MDNFLQGVLASILASYIVYLTSKLFKKVKSPQTRLRVTLILNLQSV